MVGGLGGSLCLIGKIHNVRVNQSMAFKRLWNVSFGVLTSRLWRFNLSLERVANALYYSQKLPREIARIKKGIPLTSLDFLKIDNEVIDYFSNSLKIITLNIHNR